MFTETLFQETEELRNYRRLRPVEAPVRSVTVLSPDRGAPGPVAFEQRDGRLMFQVDRLDTYSLAAIATGR